MVNYIWSRIVQLSLAKANNDNLYEMHLKLNQWFKNVHHDTYDAQDNSIDIPSSITACERKLHSFVLRCLKTNGGTRKHDYVS